MTLSASSILCLAGLHFLWQGAAIAAVAWLMGTVARRFSSQAQYVVLTAGLTVMPLVFVGTVRWLASSANDSSAFASIAEQPLETMSEADESRPLYLLADPAASAASTKSAIASPLWQRYSLWLAATYWLAVAGLSLRLLLGLGGARRLARESASVSDPQLIKFVAERCQLLGIRTVPLVAYCRDVAVPTVIGVLKPTILLPLAATTGMTGEEIETILTHELVHIRRHDQLLVLWQRIVEILFFFHPAVWLLSRRISDVREHCCDDRVIALGVEPQVYVESLLRAAELSLFGRTVKPNSALAVALSAVDQPSKLRERILRLVDHHAPAPLKLRPAALAIAMGLLLVTLAAPFALQTFAQQNETKPAEPSKNSTAEEDTNSERINAINGLILKKFEAAHDGHAAEANAHAFIRRIFLDLTGRPPTEDELRDWTKRFASQVAGEVQKDPKGDRAALEKIFGEGLVIISDGGRVQLGVPTDKVQVNDFRSETGSQFDLVVTGRRSASARRRFSPRSGPAGQTY